MLRNLLFLGLIAFAAVTNSKRIEKRHSLVSRFTSNPFFLRHFGVNRYYNNDYEVHPRKIYFSRDTDDYDSSEEVIEEKKKYDRITPVDEEQEEKIAPVVNDFSLHGINILKEEEEENKDTDENVQTIVYQFKSLPHYEQLTKFRQEDRIIPIIEEQQEEIAPVIKVFPVYDRSNIFENEEENKEIETGNDQTVTYQFKSLPHFEKLIRFREPPVLTVRNTLTEDHQIEDEEINNKVNKSSQNIGKGVAVVYFFNSLPHYERLEDFAEKEKLFVSQVNESSQNEASEDIVPFKLLPHFDRTTFRQEKPSKRRVVKVIRRKKKLLPKSEDLSIASETGFGRRLTPKKIESIADIPLENSEGVSQIFDSYGDLLSPTSS